MTGQFKAGHGDWSQYQNLPDLMEVDLHWSDFRRRELGPPVDYYEKMGKVWDTVKEALETAQREGKRYVLFTHGWSTSRRGNTTARSQVRSLMRSKEATPYIIRKECIQHNSVFVAAIRQIERT